MFSPVRHACASQASTFFFFSRCKSIRAALLTFIATAQVETHAIMTRSMVPKKSAAPKPPYLACALPLESVSTQTLHNSDTTTLF
jgi:hypothetical protein